MWIWLRPKVRGMLGVTSRKKGVGRAGGRQHHRARGVLAQGARHLGEVRRDEVEVAVPVGLAGGGGEEVADVAQVVAALAAQVRALVERVHLVDAQAHGGKTTDRSRGRARTGARASGPTMDWRPADRKGTM
jgi:hypothetical protein